MALEQNLPVPFTKVDLISKKNTNKKNEQQRINLILIRKKS